MYYTQRVSVSCLLLTETLVFMKQEKYSQSVRSTVYYFCLISKKLNILMSRYNTRLYTDCYIPTVYGDLDVYYTIGMFGLGYYVVEVDAFTHYCGWTIENLDKRLEYLGLTI